VDDGHFGYITNFLKKQGACHTVALPFTLKNILRQKKKIMKIKIFYNAKI
jgi:hypothetical protein